MSTSVADRRPVTFAEVRARSCLRRTLAMFGPAFVTSVAYVDPGNFATNFAAGATHGYRLAWVIMMANLMAVLVQYLTSKVGLATGHSLPELCRQRFRRRTNAVLWVQAEVVAMATDMAEFVGAAVGLNLVFGIPLLPAGLITGVVAFGILALDQRGYRRFELVIVGLLGLVAGGLLFLYLTGSQDYARLGASLVPGLSAGTDLSLTVGIIGATVMPHVIYLHSSLQTARITTSDPVERRALLRYNRLDCLVGLGLAGLVNLAMLCVAAAHLSPTTGITDLAGIHAGLVAALGGSAGLAFGVALIASGMSSSSVGTFAGQVVMAGFMGWRIPLAIRRVLTMVPSLLVLSLSVNTGQALVLSQIVLSFGIPFALVPLVLLTSSRRIMNDMPNRRVTTVLAGTVTVVITGLNLYLIVSTLSAA